MFCPTCGAQNPDDSRFCQTCGKSMEPAPFTPPVQAVPQAPQAPVCPPPPVYAPEPQPTVAPQPPAPPQPRIPATAKQKKAAVILALVAVFALVMGFVNTFCMVELPVSVDADLSGAAQALGMNSSMDLDLDDLEDMGSAALLAGGLDLSGSIVVVDVSMGILSEVSDLLDTATSGQYNLGTGMGYVGLILFGIINLAIAAFGVLYYLQIRTVKKDFFPFLKGKSPLALVGLAGTVGAIAQILLMFTTGLSESIMGMSAGISIGVHWSTWLSLILYGALAGYELLRLDKTQD